MDNNIADAPAKAQLPRGRCVDHHVTQGLQNRRKGVMKVILYPIDEKSLSLPAKIMVMGHGRHPRLCQKFRNGHPQGDVHWDRQGVFRDDEVNFKPVAKRVEFFFEVVFSFLDALG